MQDQETVPKLGFGTYGRRGRDGMDALSVALEVGYRHFDTAQDYDTEREVGEAIRASGIARDAIFVTTKIAKDNLGEGALVPSLKRSLETMGVDRVDLTLIHWPVTDGSVPLPVYLEQLAEAKALGLTTAIGVSNFTIALLEEARQVLGPDALLTNQVELNPLFQNRKLADYCTSAGILVTCYLPIAHGTVGEEPTLRRIADDHGATPEQIALAFELAKGYVAIPTSGKPDRIRSNFAARNLALTPQQIGEIERMPPGKRQIDPAGAPRWD